MSGPYGDIYDEEPPPAVPFVPFVPATAAVTLAAIIRMILVRNADVKFFCRDRVYHQMADEGMQQAHIVITRQSAERPRTMDGTVNYVRGVVRVDVYSPVLAEPGGEAWVPLTRAVGCALDNPNSDLDVVATAAANGIAISYLELDDEQDIPVQPLDGEAGPAFRGTAMFFNFMIERPAAPGEQQDGSNQRSLNGRRLRRHLRV